MTTEEKAKAYAESVIDSFGTNGVPCGIKDIKHMIAEGYFVGATEALASQWKEIERDKYGFTTNEYLDTMFQELPILLWHNTDKDGEYVDRTKWADYAGDIQCDYHHYSLYMPIPIPPLKGGDA